jgi:sterol 3beta-glucosyltransferase
VLGDQPFWSDRLIQLGVSPGTVPMRELAAERLAELISQAVSDPGYGRRAHALAQQIRQEDGAGRIVEAVGRIG